MKIKFIKEYVAFYDFDGGFEASNSYKVGKIKDVTSESAQWLIDNGFAEEVKESGWWKPQDNEKYFFVNSWGAVFTIDTWDHSTLNYGRLSIGNCFKTQEAAERYRDYLKAIATVRQDEGVLTLEQAAGNRYNYYIWIHDEFGLEVHGFNADYVSVNTVLFDTREHAQASLDEHPDEWKIISNYDWSRE